jgi:hypothetical protein
MVPIGTANAAGKVTMTASAAAIRSATTPSGVVNLLATPDRCEPEPSTFTNLGQRTTVVGETFSTTNAAQAAFTYQKTQSSTLEIGISSYATKDWSAAGTASVSRSTTLGEAMPVVSHKFRTKYLTKFDYSRERFLCVYGIGESTKFYIVKAYAWAGGAWLGRAGAAPKASHGRCVPQGKGSVASAGSTTAYQFAGGFSVIAFTGSSVTGYDTNASINFAFPWGFAYLCGLSSQPGHGDPKILFAQTNG